MSSDRRDDEVWDLLVCEECGHEWPSPDVDPSWTEEPEAEHEIECPRCRSPRVMREERG